MEHLMQARHGFVTLLEGDVSLERVVHYFFLGSFLGRFQDRGRCDGDLVGVRGLLDKLGLICCHLFEPTFLEERLWRCRRGAFCLAAPPEE